MGAGHRWRRPRAGAVVGGEVPLAATPRASAGA